jgi:hypothetical protein
VMFLYSPMLTAIVLAAFPAYIAISAGATPLFRRLINEKFKRGAENQAFLVESVAGMETLKAMAVEPQMQRSWEEQLAGYVAASFRVTRLGNTASQTVPLISKLVTARHIPDGARRELSVGFCRRLSSQCGPDRHNASDISGLAVYRSGRSRLARRRRDQRSFEGGVLHAGRAAGHRLHVSTADIRRPTFHVRGSPTRGRRIAPGSGFVSTALRLCRPCPDVFDRGGRAGAVITATAPRCPLMLSNTWRSAFFATAMKRHRAALPLSFENASPTLD